MTLPALIYLDNMSTTPLDPRVAEVMISCLKSPELFGNPSSQTHRYGWQAAEAIEKARWQVADLIHAQAKEIVWTSGATEAINLAIKGAALFYQRKGKHIVTLQTEHKAVLNTIASLEREGFSVTYLKPDSQGVLQPEMLRAALKPETLLVSLSWVNNETGVIQDIEQMAKITRENGVILHVDAAQAPGKLAINLEDTPIDLLSLSAHKVYGPKGIGALFVRQNPRIRLSTLIHGGEQEQGIRSGTLPTHQIMGMGEAFAIAKAQFKQDQEHVNRLSQWFWHGLQELGGVTLNGSFSKKVAHCLNIHIDGIDAESLLLSLTKLALSTGSACHSAHQTPSHVLSSMGLSHQWAQESLRIGIGRFTRDEDIEAALNQFSLVVESLRQLSPLWAL
jgi:cysteine desulfurase